MSDDELRRTLEAYVRDRSGEEKIIRAFMPLIESAALATKGRWIDAVDEWKAESLFWFFYYLRKFDPTKCGGVRGFGGYVKMCLHKRLIFEAQKRQRRREREFAVNMSGVGYEYTKNPSRDEECAADDHAEDNMIFRANPSASAEEEFFAPVVTAEIESFEDAILCEMRNTCTDRQYAIFGSHYAGRTEARGVVPVQTLAALYGIGCSRVNQIRADAKVIMFQAAARVSIKRMASQSRKDGSDVIDTPHLAPRAFVTIGRAFEKYSA